MNKNIKNNKTKSTSKTKTKFPSRIDYAYTYDVDPMGYQTGNFPKSNYWKDRNDV